MFNMSVSTFVRLDDACHVEYRVIAGEAEIELGDSWSSELQLVASERGLASLVAGLTGALALIREKAATTA